MATLRSELEQLKATLVQQSQRAGSTQAPSLALSGGSKGQAHSRGSSNGGEGIGKVDGVGPVRGGK